MRKETIKLKKGDLRKTLIEVIAKDEPTKKLIIEQPLLCAVFDVLLRKIEKLLFGEED